MINETYKTEETKKWNDVDKHSSSQESLDNKLELIHKQRVQLLNDLGTQPHKISELSHFINKMEMLPLLDENYEGEPVNQTLNMVV